MRYCYLMNEEHYHEIDGDHDNHKSALQELNDSGEIGDSSFVWIAEVYTPDVSDFIPEDIVESILETMGERAWDDCGEHAVDFPNLPKDIEEDLERKIRQLLIDCVSEHSPVRFFGVRNEVRFSLEKSDSE